MEDYFRRTCPKTCGKPKVVEFICVHVRKLTRELEKEFPNQLEFSQEGTPQVTGWLEVSVNGKLIHSKKNGNGYIDTSAKMQKIKDAIKALL
ncbi:selenoprotein W [Mactra antiquata]